MASSRPSLGTTTAIIPALAFGYAPAPEPAFALALALAVAFAFAFALAFAPALEPAIAPGMNPCAPCPCTAGEEAPTLRAAEVDRTEWDVDGRGLSAPLGERVLFRESERNKGSCGGDALRPLYPSHPPKKG